MKGKGFEITAKNIVNGDPTELARPLTTDEYDNVILYDEQEVEAGDRTRR